MLSIRGIEGMITCCRLFGQLYSYDTQPGLINLRHVYPDFSSVTLSLNRKPSIRSPEMGLQVVLDVLR